MPFDNKLWQTPAVRGDVARLSLNVSITLDRIVDALENIQNDKAIDEEIEEIRNRSRDLFASFKELTGWTPDEC